MPRTSSKKPFLSVKTRKLKPVKGKLFGLVAKKQYQIVLPSAWNIFKKSNSHLKQHKKLFGLISLIYLGLTMLLVRGFSLTTDLGLAKQAFEELLNGAGNGVTSSLAIFGYLVGTNSPNSEVAAVYQSIIIVLVSLATIWALRQTHAKEKISLKDSFYKSTYPLIQFLLVLMVVGLQFIPFVLGNFLFSATVGSEVAVSVAEKLLWSLASFLLVLWTMYLVSSSIFALYIVTLPDIAPLQALRSAKKLVKFRRWSVIRKLLFLPFILVVILTLVMLPTIMLVTPISEVVFLILISSVLVVSHSYVYSLYRELL
jgi:hypothetical protein